MTQADDAVTVSYAGRGGHYTIHMFDHVRVHVTSHVSHAHGHSLSLHLLHCGPVLPLPGVLPVPNMRSNRGNTNELGKVSDMMCIMLCATFYIGIHISSVPSHSTLGITPPPPLLPPI